MSLPASVNLCGNSSIKEIPIRHVVLDVYLKIFLYIAQRVTKLDERDISLNFILDYCIDETISSLNLLI